MSVPVPVHSGSAQLKAKGLERMDGASNGNFDVWIAENGEPEMVPFHDADGQFYDEDALHEILHRY
jgi:hypothetical protein